MLHQKDLNITEENKNKNSAKFKFKVQSARSHRCFDLDFDCMQETLAQVNLIYIGKYIKGMTKRNIKIHLKFLKFQSEIQNV